MNEESNANANSVKPIQIRPINKGDKGWVASLINELWGSVKMVVRGSIYHVDELPGFIAILEDEPVGVVTYFIEDREVPVLDRVSLSVTDGEFIIIEGKSGSGKSATVKASIDDVIFEDVLKPEIDYSKKVDEILEDKPFWTSLEDVDPELAEEIEKVKRIKSLKKCSMLVMKRNQIQIQTFLL